MVITFGLQTFVTMGRDRRLALLSEREMTVHL